MASVQEARAEGSGNIVVQLAGDHSTVNIEGLPHLSLVPLAARTAKAPGGAEIHLLNPYRRAIDLVGRESDLEELWRWPHSERAISVRTIVGRAGAGKTRIAIELMSRLGERKPKEWHAGFLESKEMRRFAGQQNLSQWGWRRPTLLVLDYAATLAQPLREWLRELAGQADGRSAVPLRLLLLEREASLEGGWYGSLQDKSWSGAGVMELFDPLEPVRLQPLDTAARRREVLAATLAEAARVRGTAPPALPEPGRDPGLTGGSRRPCGETRCIS